VDEPLVFQGDSYNLAFAACIHPDSYSHSVNKAGHIPQITMLNYERETLYGGAICVAFMQSIYLYLLWTFINDATFVINKQCNFAILIPRILSSLMMHMVVMPDARQGLRLMKFAYKHPHCFRCVNETK